MRGKALAHLNMEDLHRLSFDCLHNKVVSAVLLALGSNYRAEHHLAHVRQYLAELGDIQLSTAFQNPDFTATLDQPKPDYINQCVYLTLKKSMTLIKLQSIFKQLEKDCGRDCVKESKPSVKQSAIKKVTMDIDILAVKLDPKQNSLSRNLGNNWTIIAERYPFKTHEIIGIEELVKSGLQ